MYSFVALFQLSSLFYVVVSGDDTGDSRNVCASLKMKSVSLFCSFGRDPLEILLHGAASFSY